MGAVADAITAEINSLNVTATSPGLAELAISLAESVDDSDAPTARAAAARELRAVMADLRRLAPAGQEGDSVDGIARDREARRAHLRSIPAADG